MSALVIRRASASDAPGMVAVINPLIQRGDTTAHQTLFDARRMRDHYQSPAGLICCFLAELDSEVLGFQALEWSDPKWPGPDRRPEGWGMIATFVKDGMQRRGIGGRLFSETLNAARDAGVIALDATIRADNRSGLSYYMKMGFQEDGRLLAVPMSNGVKVDRIRKSFRL